MDLIRRALRRPSRTGPAKPAATARPKPARTPPLLLPKDDLHGFWRDPDAMNRPERYLEHHGRSAFLLAFAAPYIHPESTILEVGCNVGRNLAHLFETGYRRLAGIEINSDALDLLRRTYPELGAAIELINAPVEDAIRTLPEGGYDLVFTMAVLEHIHPDSEWVFDDMVRITRGTIVTVEDERGVSRHHTPRDYRQVFESRGMRQVAHTSIDPDGGFGTAFEARAFRKAPGA